MKTIIFTTLITTLFIFSAYSQMQFSVITPVSTSGAEDGQLCIAITGNAGPFTLAWSNGVSDVSNGDGTEFCIDDLAEGNYCLSITNAYGCETILCEDIGSCDNATIILSFDVTGASGPTASDGAIDLTVSGSPTSTYTYLWDGILDTDEDVSGLPSGNYCVKVTNVVCSVSNYECVDVCELPLEKDSSNPCDGQNNGWIHVSIVENPGAYTYTWDTGATGEFLDNLSAGTYCVVVEDAFGCSREFCIDLENSDGQIIANATTSASGSGANNGAMGLSVSGGSPPYTYQWPVGVGGPNDVYVTGLSPGIYCVTITDQCNATTTECGTVDCYLELKGVVSESCPGEASGSINVFSTYGVAPFSYNWDTGATTQNLANVGAGTYYVTVTDDFGCVESTSFDVLDYPAMNVAYQSSNTCFGQNDGAIDVNVTGGTPLYSYSWSDGSTSQDLMGLDGGSYYLTVTDLNGCTEMLSVSIVEYSDIVIMIDDFHNSSASGVNDGFIEVSISGGTGPYNYDWDGPSSYSSQNEDIYSLEPGSYTLLVTDVNGCKESISQTIVDCFDSQEEPPNPPSNVSVNGSIMYASTSSSNDGSIVITVTGGLGGYTINWTGPSGFVATSDYNLQNLDVGTYCVYVTDGCSSQNVCFEIKACNTDGVEVDYYKEDTCPGYNAGLISLTLTTGVPPYNVSWSTGESALLLNGLSVGTYTVTVTDNVGCSDVKTIIINASNEVLPQRNGCSFYYFCGSTYLYTLQGVTYEVLPPDANNDGYIDACAVLEYCYYEGNDYLLSVNNGTTYDEYSHVNGVCTKTTFCDLTAYNWSIYILDEENIDIQYDVYIPNAQAYNTYFPNYSWPCPPGNYYVRTDICGDIPLNPICYPIAITGEVDNREYIGQDYEDGRSSKLSFEVIPNPFQNTINVSFELQVIGDIGIEIYDITGRMVFNSSVTGEIGENTVTIDFEQPLPAGTYIVKLVSENLTFDAELLLKQD